MTVLDDHTQADQTSARLHHELDAAFVACTNGAGTPVQQAMMSAAITAVGRHLSASAVADTMVQHVSASVGSFADVNALPFADCNPLQRWVRNESASADRSVPALRTMSAVYDALLAAADSSGAGLRVANGVNIVGVDASGRRWLMPKMSRACVDAAVAADTWQKVRAAASSPGAVAYTWSVIRPFYVPDAGSLREQLPLPDNGRYLMVYCGAADIITKRKFVDAFSALAAHMPVSDLLIWDTTGDGAPTLWSIRGMIGHRDRKDYPWSPTLHSHAANLQRTIRTDPSQ